MRAFRPKPILAALLVAAAACGAFAPPRPATVQRLRPMPLARHVPERFVVELESPALTGVFDAVLAVGERGFALQLFPDVGGKVFDLGVGADRIVAETPAGGYEARLPLDAARPHLALVFAAAFAELLAPVGADRVLGERQRDGRVEVRLLPALGSGEVLAELAPDGAVAAYRIRLGDLRFRLGGDGRIEGPRLRAVLSW